MNLHDAGRSPDPQAGAQADLRIQIASAVEARTDYIAADASAMFSHGDTGAEEADHGRRVGRLLAQLLAAAIRDGRVEARGGLVADLSRAVTRRGASTERVFGFVYLLERATLDELALDERTGATSEAWPVTAQLVRRASFDLLAAYAEHAQLQPADASIVDPRTTLFTRPLFDAVLAKEVERAGRFGDEISLIVFDVDRLAEINESYGYGVGDKILERLGILIRQYFRQHDWVAHHSEDSIAVLLTRLDADRASALAEHVRTTVEQRLEFPDYRTDLRVAVTLSAGIVNVCVAVGDVIDPVRLLADAEAALDRAKRLGRNRVERVDGASGTVRLHTPAGPAR
ncbi:MAG TPA: GGDEF domain-containing protein [Vicinamibacterales bacterium]